MKKWIGFIVIFAAVAVMQAQTKKEPILVTDLLRIHAINNVMLNADASMAIFSVTAIEPEGDSKWEHKYVTQLWMVPTNGAAPAKPLTTSKEGASQPALSPDGQQLVFVRPVEGKSQLFLLSLQGGEAKQLTKHKYGAFNPVWAPDGRKLFFAASIPVKELITDSVFNTAKALPAWPAEKPGFSGNNYMAYNAAAPDPNGSLSQVRAYLELNEKDKKAKVINKLQFQQEATTNAENSTTQLFSISTTADASPKLLTTGFYNYTLTGFLPATSQLIVSAAINDQEHPDRVLGNSIYTLPYNGGAFQKVLGKKDYNYAAGPADPGGKWMALQHGPTSFVTVPSLALLPVGGGEEDLINIPLDRNKGNINWYGNDQLYFTSPSNGGNLLYRYDIKKKTPELLTSIHEGIGSYAVKNNRLVYVKTNISNPFELYVADANGGAEKRLTQFNEAWLQQKQLSTASKYSFKNDKGMEVEYWVMKPAGYVEGKKYPAILEIHGGPSAMWGTGESSMWHEFQYYCSKGYVVVYANPRGSGGYGIDFLRGNLNDWGAGPTSDVLTALNKAVAMGDIDTANLFVTGGSYAGYLVAWIVAHDKRFKAACAQRGVYDLQTFFGEGNAWRLVPNYFGGYPWEPKTKANLERESPISYVQNITTPLIIFHGENDLRTGVIQSEQLYKSLKVLNRPVEYVRHPGATHELTRSGNNRQRIDQMLRTWEFFERFRK